MRTAHSANLVFDPPMADAPAKKKIAFDHWANQRQGKTDHLLEQRTKLWEALNAFISQQGGWVVSPPGSKSLRVEIQQKSVLPAQLLELGYAVRSAGIGTRITSGKFLPVDVIEISLPGK